MKTAPSELRPLAGIRVLEVAASLPGRYAGRVLADLGAEVIRSSDRRASAHDTLPATLEEWLDAGKTVEPPRATYEILLIDDDISVDIAAAVRVRLSDYERDGPWHGRAACHLTVQHASGLAWHQAAPVSDPEAKPPRSGAARDAVFAAGVGVAVAALWGLMAWRGGATKCVDFSLHGFLSSLLIEPLAQLNDPRESSSLQRQRRPGQHIAIAGGLVWLLPCSDGFIMVSPRENHQWERWTEVIGQPAWSRDMALCGDREARMANAARLQGLMAQWSCAHTRAEVFEAAQAGRVACFPLNTAEDLLHDEQLAHRGFLNRFCDARGREFAMPGLPFRMRDGAKAQLGCSRVLPDTSSAQEPWWQPMSYGVDAQLHGALAGLRVLDFSWVMAGPLCTKLLGAMGADVIKVECASRPEFANRSGWFAILNNSKRSCAIDLGDEEGRTLAARLARECDVVIENFSAGVMERHGLGYESLSAEHRGIIYASASGLGRTGPQRSALAYGTLLQAYSGRSSLIGDPNPGLEAMGVLPAWTDPVTAWWETLSILAAVVHRRRTGRGSAIDLSMLECTVALLPEALLAAQNADSPLARPNLEVGAAPSGCYRCAGADAWVALSVRTDAQWEALCAVLRFREVEVSWASDAAARSRHKASLDALVADRLRELDAGEVEGGLLEAGVPASRSRSLNDVLEEGMLPTLFPRLPDGTLTIAMPWTDETAWRGRITPTPRLGEHGDEVRTELLGAKSPEYT